MIGDGSSRGTTLEKASSAKDEAFSLSPALPVIQAFLEPPSDPVKTMSSCGFDTRVISECLKAPQRC